MAAKEGLMGAVADAVLANGGTVMGVIPKVLTEWEHQHLGLTELAVVPDMHSRKKMMYDMSDAAIMLPGGFGTLDELFEMLTWNQLKIHDKKIYILNSGGFLYAISSITCAHWKKKIFYTSRWKKELFFAIRR